MKIVVIGGTGVLGSKVVGTLRDRGHETVAASIVGCDQLPESGYMRAKVAQEDGIDNVGGPDKITLEQMARDVLAKRGDSKTAVVVDPDATLLRGAARHE
jgi:uncharacterized protein YbjT (DUF2867 family)